MKRDHILTITSIVPFVGFVPLAWWAQREPHPSLDIKTTRMMQKAQSSLLRSTVLVGNTLTGSAIILNVLALPVALLFWKRRMPVEALMTVGISWTGTLVRTLIKNIVDRPRPERELVQIHSHSWGTSFPSGHVSSTLNFWGWLLAWMLLQKKEVPSPYRRILMNFAGLCILLIGPSRIYMGEHWLTDVLGAYLLGTGWLSLAIQLYLRIRKTDEHM